MTFLLVGSQLCTRASFRPFLTETPLPLANTFVNVLTTLTGFTYKGLPPHKFTPMPDVHNKMQLTQKADELLSRFECF